MWALVLMTVVRFLPVAIYRTAVRFNPLDHGREIVAMLMVFASAGFVAQQRTGEIHAAVSTGATVALAVMGSILSIVAVFDGGGLRAVALSTLILTVVFGAFFGAIGGVLARTVTAVRTSAFSGA